jgi:hypothetical protein
MRKEAKAFWGRARECRVVATTTRDEAARKLLLELAEELEAEAAKIEAETPEPS